MDRIYIEIKQEDKIVLKEYFSILHAIIMIITITSLFTYTMYYSIHQIKNLYDINNNLTEVKFKLKKEIGELYKIKESIPNTSPIKNNTNISSYFGIRINPITKRKDFHLGIDIPVKIGTPVFSTADGLVINTKYDSVYGNKVTIKHNDIYKTIYGHLNNITVKEGEKIKKGYIIGASGNTGRSSGPHLHYEVIKNNNAIDPLFFLKD
jgi:murein DD-endopeptidase MepM/ murein hydrolase activator NlpD